MSSMNGSKNCEEMLETKSSDSEELYQIEEDLASEESLSESLNKLKNISIQKNHIRYKKSKKNYFNRCSASPRYRQVMGKNKCRNSIRIKSHKKSPVKSQKCLENKTEIPKKGKRCRLGGKAKGNPPEEESQDKCDSDDDGDSSYFSRISLGYFQKFRDKSGASTSYQLDDSYKNLTPSSKSTEKLTGKTSEEKELLELQLWGRTGLMVSCHKTEKPSIPDDTI